MAREFNLLFVLRNVRSTLTARQPAWVWAIVVFDVLLLILCFIHLPSFFNRAQPPFRVQLLNDQVTVRNILDERSAAGIREGDKILTWNEFPVTMLGAIEFMSDLSSVGQPVRFTVEREGKVLEITCRLIPAVIPARFVVITYFVGCAIWLIGIFVLLSRPYERTGRILHWGAIAFGTVAMITWGKADPASWETIVSRTVFFISYPAAISFFLLFTALYPTPKPGSFRLKSMLIFTPAATFAAVMTGLHLRALFTGSGNDFINFQITFDLFHGGLILYALLGIANIVLSFRRAKSLEERLRLKWIVWGFAVGLLPFMFLSILPQLFGFSAIVPEEYTTIFFVAVPFSLAISFIRYRMLDIDFIINRTVLYAIFTCFIVFVAFLIALLLVSLVRSGEDFSVYMAIVLITFLVALLIAPLRTVIQRLMDQRFFAARSSFRTSLRTVTEEIRNSLSSYTLFQTIILNLPRVIPIGGTAIYRYHNGALVCETSKGEIGEHRFPLSDEDAHQIAQKPSIALSDIVPSEGNSASQFLGNAGFSLCGTLSTEKGELIGLVCLNPRVHSQRFSGEEVDFLTAVCAQASEVLGRLLLQEQVFRKEQEKTALKELSDMKSFFVSSVSHELRNPLTSIRLGAETLRSGSVHGRRNQAKYLRIIEGESNRLSRLIGNVLDFSKIERRSRTYQFKPVRLDAIVRRAAAIMKYEVKKGKGKLALRLPSTVHPIDGDADALQEVLLNLLSNAFKYSGPKKEVTVALSESRNYLSLSVADRGIGISLSEQSRIFDPFYQGQAGSRGGTGGAGLGLAIVKHIIDAHRATISVESSPGKGSRFVIDFPRSVEHSKG